jgi:prepilin-type N-terminal cleavage/methylation domain-containing protein
MNELGKPAGRDGRAGFSLIEVVIAVTVLTVGILAVVPMLTFAIKANRTGKDYAFATFLAQQRLEQVYAWPFYEDADPSAPAAYPGVTQAGVAGETAGNGTLFGVENVLDDTGRQFMRTTELVRNGYLSNNVVWGGSSGFSEGDVYTGASGSWNSNGQYTGGSWNDAGASLNTNAVAESTGVEDFKMIRVRVTWYDQLGNGPSAAPGVVGVPVLQAQGAHEIERHMFLAKF